VVMQVDISAATTLDGFIARKGGNSDWVSDDELFQQSATAYGAIALGHTTFTQFEGSIFPLHDVEHFVLTSHPGQTSKYPNVHFVATPQAATTGAQRLGKDKLLVIGGAQTNQSFVDAGLVSRVMLNVHPICFGTGLTLLGNFAGELHLKLENYKQYPAFLHLEYVLESAPAA